MIGARGNRAPGVMCIVAATVTLCALLPQLAWAEAAAGNATVRVDSAQALQNAIDEGINNVVITAHLDIRGLSPTRQGQAASNVKLLVQNTQFIQGDCQTGFSGDAVLGSIDFDPPMIQRKTGQCAIVSDSDFFEVNRANQDLSISNLYLRMQRPPTSFASQPKDSTIQNMNGSVAPIAELRKKSSLVLDNCILKDNTNLEPDEETGGAAISVEDTTAQTPCAVMVTGSTLSGNAEPLFSVSKQSSGSCYIDTAAQVWDVSEEETFPAKSIQDANEQPVYEAQLLKAADKPPLASLEATNPEDPGDGTEPPGGGLPDGPDDPEVPINPDAPGTEGSDPEDPSFPTLGYVGIALAVIAVIVGALAYLVIRNRRKKTADAIAGADSGGTGAGKKDVLVDGLQHGQQPPLSGMGPGYHLGQPGGPAGMLPPWYQSPYIPSPAPGPNTPYGSVGRGSQRSAMAQASTDTRGNTTTMAGTVSWGVYADKGESQIEQLEAALDAFFDRKLPFFGRYHLFSAVERRVGGQGLVQFARIGDSTEMAAIKFYLQRTAFDSEKELYMDTKLCKMMPATLAIEDNMSGEWRTPYGFVFPPFVIIERGQSLDEWARDNNPDFITIFQALSHSVRALKELHKVGYAHRDIKPGNVLRRPTQHDWTLIDFGCAAPIGITARLTLSLKYAAPETITALEAGCHTIHVDAAVDIWAIGVIAFELLTGERAFQVIPGETPEQCDKRVKAGIAGRAPLPWEAKAEGSEEKLKKMRGLKRTVLRCLARDPAARPSADQLLHSWDHTFDNMQTRGTDWSATSGGSAGTS